MLVLAGISATTATAPRSPATRSAPTQLGIVRGFVENCGQWPASIAFAASADDQWLHVQPGGFTCGRGAHRVELRSRHAAALPARGIAVSAGVCNFLLGSDPREHVVGARIFAAVEQPAVAPGIDLVVRRAAPGHAAVFAYDVHMQPGAQLDALEFDVHGARSLRIDAATGDLVLDLDGEELRHSEPAAWRDVHGRREPLACSFELRGPATFGFRVAGDQGADAVCIDPDLRWGTCIGGSASDNGNGIATAQNGDVFVAGTLRSTSMPGTGSSFDPTWNGGTTVPGFVGDGYVARFRSDNGALLWCTYLGGTENDHIELVRSIGNDAVITGWTSSTDYPTTPGAFDTTHNGTGDGYTYYGGDVIVTRLAANGQSLVWSTFLGGAMLEYGIGLAVAPNGEVAVSGHVHSLNFPTTPGCYRSTRLSFSDLFVSRLSADGTALLGSTYCGGSDGEEYPYALAFAANGDLIAAGATDSSDLPVTAGTWDPTYNGGTEHFADGFVLRLNGTCSQLLWCTYLGTPANEYVRGLAVHGDGSLTLTGIIDGPGLPTTPQSLGPAPFGNDDGFAWRLSGDGTTTHWATYVGGSADDLLYRAIDLGGGRTAIAGTSSSVNVPTTRGSAFPNFSGGQNGWLVVLGSDGRTLDYGTTVGVWGAFGTDVSRAPNGELTTTGTNFSSQFSVTAGGLPYVGGGDAYVLRVSGLPLGMQRIGAPSGVCGRGARVMARSGPFVGESAFALTAGDIPPISPTVAGIATGTLGTPTPVLGVDLWIDPAALITTLGVAVDAHGCARLPVPVPANASLVGATLAAQFLWLDACPGLSCNASDAVTITVQP